VDNIPSLLKAFVITGGVLLVGGTLLLLALLVQRAGGEERVLLRQEAAVGLPRGARVEQVTTAGERWLLLGTDSLGQQFLVEVDPRTGERLGLLWLQPER
jgi:hypothetical protein